MNSIERPELDNAGSVVSVEFIERKSVISFIEHPFYPEIIVGFTLVAGTAWRPIMFTDDTARFTDNHQEDEHGELWRQALEMFIPRLRTDIKVFLNRYVGPELLAIVTDANAVKHLVGGLDSPAKLSAETDTANFGGRNGAVFRLSATSTAPALEVRGEYTIAEAPLVVEDFVISELFIAPINLQATFIETPAGIQVTWNYTGTVEPEGFQVWKSINGSAYAQVAVVPFATPFWTDPAVPNADQVIRYQVRAYSGAVVSPFSDFAQLTIMLAPTWLRVENTPENFLILEFEDNTAFETGHRMERSADGGPFTKLVVLPPNITVWEDELITENILYYYRVRAINADSQSAFSNVVEAVALSQPTGLLAAKGTTDGTIFVGWTNTHGTAATAVELYRKIGAGSFALLATLGASAESYEDTYVITDSISREYRVRATRGSFVSPDSNTDAVSIPAQVTGLTLTHQGAGVVLVSWTDVSAIETGYEIEYSPNGTTGWTNVGSTPANDTSELLALAENATSHIRVRATGDSPGAWSAVASIAIPAAPSLLTADFLGLGEILLSWQDNATNETGQRLEYSTNGTSWSTLIVLAADVETYIHTGRAVNATHFYRVRAETATANSNYSNTVQVAIPATPTGFVVAQPTAINANTPQPNMLRITWTDAATNETAYEVYRHTSSMTDPEAEGTLLATLPAGTTAYNDLSTLDGTTYFYAVRAITATAEGAFVQASGKSLDVTVLEVQPNTVTNGRRIITTIGKTGTAAFWDFGDGSAIVQSNTPDYTYAVAGTYNVKMYADRETVTQMVGLRGRWTFNLSLIGSAAGFTSLQNYTDGNQNNPTIDPPNVSVTGSIDSLNNGLLTFTSYSNAPITGNADLKTQATNFTLFTTGPVVGTAAGISRFLNLLVFRLNNFSGSIIDIPRTVTRISLTGGVGGVSGNNIDFPRGLVGDLQIYTPHNHFGPAIDLPRNITLLLSLVSGVTTGNPQDLPANLTQCWIRGLSGSPADFRSIITSLYLFDTEITGNISGFGSNKALLRVRTKNDNQLTGSVNSILNTNLNILTLTQESVTPSPCGTLTYTAGSTAWRNNIQTVQIAGNLSSSEVDAIFIDIAARVTTSGTGRSIDLRGNDAPTAASLAARNTLTSNGYTVTHA